jgi:hypothetical protein
MNRKEIFFQDELPEISALRRVIVDMFSEYKLNVNSWMKLTPVIQQFDGDEASLRKILQLAIRETKENEDDKLGEMLKKYQVLLSMIKSHCPDQKPAEAATVQENKPAAIRTKTARALIAAGVLVTAGSIAGVQCSKQTGSPKPESRSFTFERTVNTH